MADCGRLMMRFSSGVTTKRAGKNTARVTQLANSLSFSKRLFDISLVVLASPVWIPAMGFTALAILLTSGSPVVYLSKRYVQKNKYHTVFKFRTMVKNADQVANRDTVPPAPGKLLNIEIDESLYTPLGKTLERIHFTELPQLLQVLTGTLTLVGNRPMPDNMLQMAREVYPYIEERFSIPSGITGPAQLAGRDRLTDQERLRLEISYAMICQYSYSPILDFILLLITLCTPFGIFRDLTFEQVENILYLRANDQTKAQIKTKMAELLP